MPRPGARTPFLLGAFYLLGAAAAVYGAPIPALRGTVSVSVLPETAEVLLAQCRMLGLLFFLGSSVIGFLVVPAAFFLRGMWLSSFVASLLGEGLPLRKILLFPVVPACFSIGALFVLGSQAFDSSRSAYDAASRRDFLWRPVSFDAALYAAALSVLSAAACQLVRLIY